MAIKQKNVNLSQNTVNWLCNLFESNQDVLYLLNIENEDDLLEALARKGEEPLKKMMREIENNQSPCPFNKEGVCTVINFRLQKCKKRFIHFTFEKVTDCNIVNRCTRALNHNELQVIQFFYNKAVYPMFWESFVFNQTKRKWKSWQLSIGKMLIEECKKDGLCPFKSLTE